MKNHNIKNLFIAGLTLLSFGFLSAQFVIPSGINNALQIIQSVLVTTSGTSTGNIVMHTNTAANNIYINPAYLPLSSAYSGQYVLTLNASGFVSFTTGTSNISGAMVSGGNLLLTLNNGTVINAGAVTGPQGATGAQGPAGATGATGAQGIQGIPGAIGATGVGITSIVSNSPTTFTINLSNGSGYTLNLPGGGSAGPWEYGAGLPSAQIMGANNNALGTYSVVGGYSNTTSTDSINGFIGGGQQNTIQSGLNSTIAGGGFNQVVGIYGAIGGGGNNIISGSNNATIGGGLGNFVQNADFGFIGGGLQNNVDGNNTTIAGGQSNIVLFNHGTIVGGIYNIAGQASFVGGGNSNHATGYGASIVGGIYNNIDNTAGLSAIVGGSNNTVLNGSNQFIGGGSSHIISGANNTVIGGGYMNTADDAGYGFIGAGGANRIENSFSSAVVGGRENTIIFTGTPTMYTFSGVDMRDGDYNAIVGGLLNNIRAGIAGIIAGGMGNAMDNGLGGFIGAGLYNRIFGGFMNVIAGGTENIIHSSTSVIGGGEKNNIYGDASVIVGGQNNNIGSLSDFGAHTSFIGGGAFNTIQSGSNGFIGGGLLNEIYGSHSFIGGGEQNIASGSFAAIPGGFRNRAYGDYSFAAGRGASALHEKTFVRNGGMNNVFSSTISNMFLIDASNGVAINTNTRVTGSNAALTINGILNAQLPSYADDAAAGGAGLVAGDLYQTNGSAPTPLDVPGIVMIKQ